MTVVHLLALPVSAENHTDLSQTDLQVASLIGQTSRTLSSKDIVVM